MAEQPRFETAHVHPRAATVIKNMGWLFLHEHICGKGRMDFLAMNPENGDLAIVECKTSISSVASVLRQLDQYHHDFAIRDAAQWIFVWDTPSQYSSDIINLCDVKLFQVNEGVPATSPTLRPSEKYEFYHHFYRFYPCHNYFPFREPNSRAIHPHLIRLDAQEKSNSTIFRKPRLYGVAE